MSDDNIKSRTVVSKPGAAINVTRIETSDKWKREVSEAVQRGKPQKPRTIAERWNEWWDRFVT